MNASERKDVIDPPVNDLVGLLAHRYGDGLVYLRDAAEQGLFELATRLGFINSEGYLTPEGRTWLVRHDAD